MRFAFVAAAACIFAGTAVLWNVATIAVLRLAGIEVSFSLPFHLFRRKVPAILDSLRGRTINSYVVISGLLLFACPLFVGLSAYEYVVRHYLEHSTYSVKYALASAASLALLGILGVRVSISQWQRAAESGIGLAILAILALKVPTDLMGTLTAVELLVPAALCCAFAYFGLRRIGGTLSGKQYPSRRDMGVQRNFVSEKFVPSENPNAEEVAMVQKLIASGTHAGPEAGTPYAPVDSPSCDVTDDVKR
jgi:hypothetical protein